MYKKWKLYEPVPELAAFAREIGRDTTVAALLWHRGIRTRDAAELFLHPERLPFADPFAIRDMDKAVARIQKALAQGEHITVYGDYDVDGMTATSLLTRTLRKFGAKVDFYIPDRMTEGYGLNRRALEEIAEQSDLLVTVDCGIASVADVAAIQGAGKLDIIITDHHLPGSELPPACAVLNPHRADCPYPDKDLAGVGVAFKLCQALAAARSGKPWDGQSAFTDDLELVALGTVADIVPLRGENRRIVKQGMARMEATALPGVAALVEVAGLKDKKITAGHLGFLLAPRLNAAGRIESARTGVALLTAEDRAQADKLALELDLLNTERREIERTICKTALQELESLDMAEEKAIVVAGKGWNPGVIGIVAARLMERFSRPVIVISMHEGEGRGSGRAPDPFDLHSALADCAQYLTRFGGHAAAAGVEIEEENLAAFRQTINAWAAAHAAPPEAVSLRLDAAATLGELNLENVGELARLAPFGRENPTPVLLVQHAFVDGIWPMGAEGRHTRIRLRQGSDTLFASSFGIAPQAFAYPVGSEVEAALEVSIFNGRSGPMVSAHLKAIRPAELGNTPSEQAAWFEAFRTGGSLDAARAAALLPARADTVSLYRRIRGGHVAAADLQPVFAAEGPQNTGKTLASLTALQELGLIEEQEGRWLPVPVTAKQDLASAPVLQKLAELAKQA